MHEQSIVAYTERVAGEIASRHAEDPAAELALWLRLAHQREAMVTQLYELSDLDARLSAAPEASIHGLIRAVVHSIGAHEAAHTRLLSRVRGSAATDLTELQGQVEGWVTRSATRGGAFARLLIAVGAALGKVPEFARELREMSLLELLEFHAELETTARMGYQRILQIAARLGGEHATAQELGFSFHYDVTRVLCEENFHEAAFHEMSSWIEPGSGAPSARSVAECTRALHDLCEQHLSARAVRGAAAAEGHGLEAHLPADGPAGWVSDGGLGQVFSAAGLPVPLVRVQHDAE